MSDEREIGPVVEPVLMRPTEAAEALGCHVSDIKKLAHEGHLQMIKLGRNCFRITTQSVASFKEVCGTFTAPRDKPVRLAGKSFDKTYYASWVYVMAEEKSPQGPIKIGRSDTPAIRLKNLQAANPQILAIWAMIPTTVPEDLELAAHRLLHANRIHAGEWFNVSVYEAVEP